MAPTSASGASVRAPRRGCRRVLRVLLALFLAALVLDQLVDHVLVRDGYLLGRRIAPFDPPLFTPFQVDRIRRYRELLASNVETFSLSSFDPDLGWSSPPGSGSGGYFFDERGARMCPAAIPRARTRGVRRVVAIGCSFTFGAEVSGDECWVACVDAARPDLEIVNLGLGAFGLDQALLRWRRDGVTEHPDEVWLGVLPSAALRNVTCWMPCLSHWNQVVLLKPRFVLDEHDELVLVPCPAHSLGDLVDLIGDQTRFLAACRSDHWIARTPSAYAPLGSSLSHRFATSRILLTIAEHGGRDPDLQLLDPGSEVARIEGALVRRIAREVSAIGARFRCLILPDRGDLRAAQASGAPYWQSAVTAAATAEPGAQVIDTSTALLAAHAIENDALWAKGGHYSAKGNRIVAEAIARAVE